MDDLVTTLNEPERLAALTLEQRMAAGLDGQRQTLADWAREQGHHPARVFAAWEHGLLFVRGRRHGRLCVTLRRDLDPAHLNHNGRKSPGSTAKSEFKEPAVLKRAQREHDAAVAEAAEHEQDDDSKSTHDHMEAA